MKIITEPNKILHKKSKKIKVFDKKLRFFVEEMIEIMRKNSGVGLSAVQVAKFERIVVLEFKLEYLKDDIRKKLHALKNIPLTILINPKITKYSKEKYIACEGCLSLPETELEVERSVSVNVLANDLDGNKIKIRAKDYFARILQHEIDHTNGILITDRTNEKK